MAKRSWVEEDVAQIESQPCSSDVKSLFQEQSAADETAMPRDHLVAPALINPESRASPLCTLHLTGTSW